MSRSAARLASVLVVAAAFVASPLSAANAPWSPAHLVRLPAGGTALPQGYLPTLACAGAGDCLAAGDYQDRSSNVTGLVVTESRGVWSTGRALGAPGDAASSPDLTPYASACGAPGDCVVVGSFADLSGTTEAFIDQEVRGAWKEPVEVILPSGAAPGYYERAQLHAVACPSATHCVAVGSFTIGAQGQIVKGLVVTGGAGPWSAKAVSAPGDDPLAAFSQVACAGATCVAAGTYVDDDNATHAMVADTATSTSAEVALPGNASAFASASVGAITCAAPGDCALDGTYETSGGQLEGFADSSNQSAWGPAIELVMPASAATNPRVFFYDFAGLACHAPGQCTTGGQYVDGSGDAQGFVENEVNGAWRAATKLALPAGATQAGHNGGVVAVTCPGDGTCSAGGAYLDARGRYETLDRLRDARRVDARPDAGAAGGRDLGGRGRRRLRAGVRDGLVRARRRAATSTAPATTRASRPAGADQGANAPGTAAILGTRMRAMTLPGEGWQYWARPRSPATEKNMNASSGLKPHWSTSRRDASSHAMASASSMSPSDVPWV